jgi:hypothetical protein
MGKLDFNAKEPRAGAILDTLATTLAREGSSGAGRISSHGDWPFKGIKMYRRPKPADSLNGGPADSLNPGPHEDAMPNPEDDENPNLDETIAPKLKEGEISNPNENLMAKPDQDIKPNPDENIKPNPNEDTEDKCKSKSPNWFRKKVLRQNKPSPRRPHPPPRKSPRDFLSISYESLPQTPPGKQFCPSTIQHR